jgi:tRNA threonylcarbamoyladenosine biosynthesis protein TsaB
VIRVALETSTAFGSVAVSRDDRVVAEVALGVQTRHAESALPALESALSLAGLSRGDIGEVVVGAGPGSFTGVRVAAAMAKGLVASLEVPLVAYSSLLALVAGVPATGAVCGLFDARRGEVYAGCWRVGDVIESVLDPMVGPVAEVVARTREATPIFVGDGALRYRDLLAGAGADAARVPAVPAHPRAGVLLWLAHRHPAGARVADVAGWEPAYVRGSSARSF